MKKRGQTWSMDLIVAFSVFLLAFVLVIGFLVSSNSNVSSKELIKENQAALIKLSDKDNGIIVDGKVDSDERLTSLVSEVNGDIISKGRELGLKNKYCVFFVDENNQVIDLNKNSDEQQYGIGNDSLSFKTSDNGEFKCGSQN